MIQQIIFTLWSVWMDSMIGWFIWVNIHRLASTMITNVKVHTTGLGLWSRSAVLSVGAAAIRCSFVGNEAAAEGRKKADLAFLPLLRICISNLRSFSISKWPFAFAFLCTLLQSDGRRGRALGARARIAGIHRLEIFSGLQFPCQRDRRAAHLFVVVVLSI